MTDNRKSPGNSCINKIQRSRITNPNGNNIYGPTRCPAGQTMVDGLCVDNTYRKRNQMSYESREADTSDTTTNYNVRATSVRDYTCPSGWKILDKTTMTFVCDDNYVNYSGNNNTVIKNSNETTNNPKSTTQMSKLSNTSGYHKK